MDALDALDARDLDALADLVGRGGVVVLSGAGLSTESGIPDYRGPTGAARPSSPMTYQVFVGDPLARRRYWARSHLGWHVVGEARPNDGHRAVADLQALGLLNGVVTQNVDGLHQAAGASAVIDLHGRLDAVICLDCGARTARADLGLRLDAANPDWSAQALAVHPDGDVALADADLESFTVVPCEACGGVLKPDVVFFGENVPRQRVQDSFGLVEGARALLVLGSSLTVMSGYRFVLRAARLGVPVALINQGPTRGDAQATVRISHPLGQVLPALVGVLRHPA